MQQPLIEAFQHVSHSPVDYPLRPSTPRPPHISRNVQTHSPESLSDDTDWVSVLERAINDELSSDDFGGDEGRFGAVGPDSALFQNNTKPTLPSLTVPVTPIRIPSPPLDDHDNEHTNESLFDTEGEDLYDDDDDSNLPGDHWSTHHHGLSRLAFAHRKKFWSFRAEEYHRLEMEQHHPLRHTELGFLSAEDGVKDDEDPSNEEAYDAFFEWSYSPPTSPTSSFPTSPTISPTTSPTATQNDDDDNDPHSPPPALVRGWQPGCFIPQVPIYPRMGDLLQLRDERASLMDKAFNTFSLNTLAKILYLHDMLDRAEGRSASERAKVEDTDGDTDTETQECSAERSFSPVSSNDDTLVDEDVSGDGSGDEEKDTSSDFSVSATTSASATTREWETDWYARWQILVRKFGIDEMMKAVEAASYGDEGIGSVSSARYGHEFEEIEDDVGEEMGGRRDLQKELEDAEGVNTMGGASFASTFGDEEEKEVPARPPSRMFFLPEQTTEDDDDYEFHDDDNDNDDGKREGRRGKDEEEEEDYGTLLPRSRRTLSSSNYLWEEITFSQGKSKRGVGVRVPPPRTYSVSSTFPTSGSAVRTPQPTT